MLIIPREEKRKPRVVGSFLTFQLRSNHTVPCADSVSAAVKLAGSGNYAFMMHGLGEAFNDFEIISGVAFSSRVVVHPVIHKLSPVLQVTIGEPGMSSHFPLI